MAPPADAESTAREFAALFLGRSFSDATELVGDAGGDAAIVDAFPDAFTEPSTTAADALEAYWWGLHGQYGDPDGFELTDDVEGGAGDDVGEDEAVAQFAVEFAFADGAETAAVEATEDGVAGFAFDPAYEVPPYVDEAAFVERERTVDVGDVELDGVLTLPRDAERAESGTRTVPGVVLLHGQGVSDVDGSAGASKLLRDLAWGWASDGIAVLRYEKRLVEHDVPDDEFTLDGVVVDDAVAAVDALIGVDAVDGDGVFVAGHSLGGMAAPRVAERHGDVAGVVNLDGRPTATLDPEDADVIRYEFDREGDLDEDQAAQLEADRETIRRIDAGDFDDDETVWGRPRVWHRSLNAYDPAATATTLEVPVFVATTFSADEATQPHLADFQRKGFEGWTNADLPAGSEVTCYEGVDHYLQEGYAPRTPLSVDFGGNASRDVVADVAEWIAETAAE